MSANKFVKVSVNGYNFIRVVNAVEAATFVAQAADSRQMFEIIDHAPQGFTSAVKQLLADEKFVADAKAADSIEAAADSRWIQLQAESGCDAVAKMLAENAVAQQKLAAEEAANKAALEAANAAYRAKKAARPAVDQAAKKDAEKAVRQAALREKYAAEEAAKKAAELAEWHAYEAEQKAKKAAEEAAYAAKKSAQEAAAAEKAAAEKAKKAAEEAAELAEKGSQWLPKGAIFAGDEYYPQGKSYGQQVLKLLKDAA